VLLIVLTAASATQDIAIDAYTIGLLDSGEEGVANGVGSVDAVYSAIDHLVKVAHRLVDYNVSSVTGGLSKVEYV
jgi:ethanolamine utilization microcompartment shell protein EutS